MPWWIVAGVKIGGRFTMQTILKTGDRKGEKEMNAAGRMNAVRDASE
ncbi:MAG: hypothetical protein WBR24_17805 [Desulfobacterales bacterium]|jgi:hypothetical protein